MEKKRMKIQSLISIMMIVLVSGVVQATNISISPYSQTVSAGVDFDVDILVANVTELYSFQVDLSYDPVILEYVSFSQGTFLNSDGIATFPIPPDNSTQGLLDNMGITRYGSSNGVSGDGLLATLRFRGLADGVSGLNFSKDVLYDSNDTVPKSISHDAYDGLATVTGSVPCVITNAFWEQISATEGDIVNLSVEGTNCDGLEVNFTIWEDDVIGRNNVSNNPLNVVFNGNTAKGNWTVEYQDDVFDPINFDTDPEYYFETTLVSDGQTFDSQGNPLLEVSSLSTQSRVLRTFNQTTLNAGDQLEVTLNVLVEQGELSHAIDELLPQGWAIIDDGGGDTGNETLLKFIESSSASDTSYTYIVQAPAVGGVHLFNGFYLFEGQPDNITTLGSTDVTVISSLVCDADGDGYDADNVTCNPTSLPNFDCNDNDINVNPGETEVCNGIDDNCDSVIDETGDALCDDSVFCNGAETCAGVSGCQAGTPPVCSDALPCSVGFCNVTSDSCENDFSACGCSGGLDSECDNGVYCDGIETCNTTDSSCLAGTPPICDDSVSCTIDSCDNDLSSCVNLPDNTACSDGVFCNGLETCDLLLDCQVGTPETCDDGVSCTIDSCNIGTDSCENTPNDGSCDDTIFCNGVETCDSVLDCQVGTPETCDDGVSCTVDSCNIGLDSCENTPNDGFCDDGAFCNGVETCDLLLDCQAGTDVDCSGNNLPAIADCNNNPDNNPDTFDSADAFISTCDEAIDDCLSGFQTVDSVCDVVTCGADCTQLTQAADCDDLNPLTVDICSHSCGCVNTADCSTDDVDGDGWNASAFCNDGVLFDCDDDPATGFLINPGMDELCNNVDDDCDSTVDMILQGCDVRFNGTCGNPLDTELCQNGVWDGTCPTGEVDEKFNCTDTLDNDCDGLVDMLDTNDCEACTFICSENQYCPGDIVSSDEPRCCSESCDIPQWENCSQCGVDGFFNPFCDRNECDSVIEGCYFNHTGIFPSPDGTCDSCSDIDGCEGYNGDQDTCEDDRCGFGTCNWSGSTCYDISDLDGDSVLDDLDCDDNNVSIGECTGCSVCSIDSVGIGSGTCESNNSLCGDLDCANLDGLCGVGSCLPTQIATFTSSIVKQCVLTDLNTGSCSNDLESLCVAAEVGCIDETPALNCSDDSDGDNIFNAEDKCFNPNWLGDVNRKGYPIPVFNDSLIDKMTNLTYLDFENLSNFTIERQGFGKIEFKEPVNLFENISGECYGLNFSRDIIISQGIVEIKPNLTQLNKSAEITMNNVVLDTPHITMDGVRCDKTVCPIIEYNMDNLRFYVPHFTAYVTGKAVSESPGTGQAISDFTSFSGYSISEGKVVYELHEGCGDGVCDSDEGEDCNSCSDDCGSCPPPPDSSCFPSYTLITMSDGSSKQIKDVRVGDEILSYDFENNRLSFAVVLELESPLREGVYEINNMINVTDEHPFYTNKNGKFVWAAIDSSKAKEDMVDSVLANEKIYDLNIGDKLFTSEENWVEITSIEYFEKTIQTYNLKNVGRFNTFFANNMLVHNKGGGDYTPPITIRSFKLDKNEIAVTLKEGETKEVRFTITNNGTVSLNINLTSDSEYIDDSFSLSAGASRLVKFNVSAVESVSPDIFINHIFIKSGTLEEEILIRVNVISNESLFDVEIELSDDEFYILPGEDFIFNVSLFRLTETLSDDVNVNYVIKDENQSILLSESDTRTVGTELHYTKTLSIPEDANNDKYILYVQVVYDDKTAGADVPFAIGEKSSVGELFFYIIIALIVMVIVLLVVIIVKVIKKNSLEVDFV